MTIAVCIVGFRNEGDIVRCLAALERSTYREFRVVICENGGEAAFARLTAALPPALPGGQAVEVIQAPGNLGYAGGVNVCMAAAPEAEAWWVLNPDTQPAADALEQMARRLAAGDCDAVGCTICTARGEVESRGGRWRSWLARAESIDNGRSVDEPADEAAIEKRLSYLSGASMLVGRRFLERAGPMREDYFLYAEEVEWCLRAQSLGLRLGIASNARVLHQQGTTTGSVLDVTRRSRVSVYLDERNKLLVVRDRATALLPAAMAASFLLLLLRFARRGAWRQTGFAIDGWWAGICNRRGAPAFIQS